MYAAHFGLSRLPFENVPDPAFFFDDGEYQRILQRLTSAIGAGRGLMVVAGPIGSGKTTLSQKLMADLPESTVQLWLAEPPGSDRELFQLLLQQLGARLKWDSRVLALGVLRDLLLRRHAAGGRCIVIVDESHKFTDEVLEAIRLLNNLEQGAAKLIQILMLGQEELLEMLTRAGREPFRQRIANLEVLGRMTPQQVRDYVNHRLRVAGGEPEIFPALVLDTVAESCEGIPRLVNSLCDRALLHAFESSKAAVDTRDLLKAADEVGVYRKAFHFLVGQERMEIGPRPPSTAAPAPETSRKQSAPSTPEPTTVGPADASAWIAPAPAGVAPPPESAAASGTPLRPLLLPLALLAGGIVALVASLVLYCSRAAALYGGECLAHLVQDLFR